MQKCFLIQLLIQKISLIDAKKHIKKNLFKDFCETYQVAKAVVSWRDVRFL